MNDTRPEILQKMREMIQQKSPEERLILGASMFDFSKQLVMSSFLSAKPRLSSLRIRAELFLRYYGNDFDSSRRKKIIEYLIHQP